MTNEWKESLCKDCQDGNLDLMWCDRKRMHFTLYFLACRSFKKRVVKETWKNCLCPNRESCVSYRKEDGACELIGEKK